MTVILNEDDMDFIDKCVLAFQIGIVVTVIAGILIAAYFDGGL